MSGPAPERRIGEARQALKLLRFDREQTNERSALVLPALLNLPPDSPWSAAGNPPLRTVELMAWLREHYGCDYKPNTRETIRRRTLHRQDPEEAFAQSYARLNMPQDRVSWRYTPLLFPTAAALEKIHADVADPVGGPAESTWEGRVAGRPPWVATRLLRTPLDGPVSVELRARGGARLAVALRDPAHGRLLARAATGPDGLARLSYSNCGHAALRLDVRAAGTATSFDATIARP